METKEDSIRLARERFPTGLFQPEGSYRFGMDALLLAEWGVSCDPGSAEKCAHAGESSLRFAELGTGCGAAGLSVLLQSPAFRGIGIEIDAELVVAARHNAELLGLDARFDSVEADVSDVRQMRAIRKRFGCMDLVLANPPWHLEGSGRVPTEASRRRALFGTPQTFPQFAAAAALLLRRGGVSAWICGAHRIADLFAALTDVSLNPYFLCFLYKNPVSPAHLAFVGARLQGRERLIVTPPYYTEAPYCRERFGSVLQDTGF